MTGERNSDLTLIERAAAGDATAVAQLIDRLTPVIHLRVARILRLRVREQRNGRQEVEDFIQEVFASILDRNWYALRAWDPNRLASLDTFVGRIAEHRVYSILRSRRKSPWTDKPSPAESLDSKRDSTDSDPEQWFAERDLLDRVLNQLAGEIGEDGMMLLKTVILAELPIDEIAALTGMSKGAIYTWRSRTAKRAREIAQALLSERRR